MKLNAVSEITPVSWPELADVHPFVPEDQAEGWLEIIRSLDEALARITGFDAVSTQPNSGASGEYAGLLAIRAYLQHRWGSTERAERARRDGISEETLPEESPRNVCLIPVSA